MPYQEKNDSKQFVTAWVTCSDRAEVAALMEMTVDQVTDKAHYLRKRGVKLPNFQGANPEAKYSVEELNELIERYDKGENR